MFVCAPTSIAISYLFNKNLDNSMKSGHPVFQISCLYYKLHTGNQAGQDRAVLSGKHKSHTQVDWYTLYFTFCEVYTRVNYDWHVYIYKSQLWQGLPPIEPYKCLTMHSCFLVWVNRTTCRCGQPVGTMVHSIGVYGQTPLSLSMAAST